MRRHVTFNINPINVIGIAERLRIVREYAKRYVDGANDHYTLEDYADQAALDMRDMAIKREVKAEIRHLERTHRRSVECL